MIKKWMKMSPQPKISKEPWMWTRKEPRKHPSKKTRMGTRKLSRKQATTQTRVGTMKQVRKHPRKQPSMQTKMGTRKQQRMGKKERKRDQLQRSPILGNPVYGAPHFLERRSFQTTMSKSPL